MQISQFSYHQSSYLIGFDFGVARSEALRRAWAVLGDLASDVTVQSIKNASLSLDAEGEEGRWEVTV